jgi:hypothetical protein
VRPSQGHSRQGPGVRVWGKVWPWFSGPTRCLVFQMNSGVRPTQPHPSYNRGPAAFKMDALHLSTDSDMDCVAFDACPFAVGFSVDAFCN